MTTRQTPKKTKVLKRLQKAWGDFETFILYGGSSSSKTISTLQHLTYTALFSKKVFTLSAESLPVIKKTIFHDWKTIVMAGIFDPSRFNKSEMTYNYPSGSIFQFVPADDESRFHAMRQDYLYFDELFYIKKAIFDQGEIRTRIKTICTFNPRAEFWVRELMDNPEVFVDHSTYKDNPFVEKKIIEAIKRRELTDPNFYRVYGLGKFGTLEGLIFDEGTNWRINKDFPESYSKQIYGLDFGYTIDPSALVDIGYQNGELWLKEKLYKKGMTNKDLAPYIDFKTIADSSEPKSIEELKQLKCNVKPSVKGPGSIDQGIQLLKQFKINVHPESLNLIKEFRNYAWEKNRQGEYTGKPIDDYNHLIDATRYGTRELFFAKNIFFL